MHLRRHHGISTTAVNIMIKSQMSKLGQVRPVASRHKQRSQLHSSQELLHLCRWSRVSLQAVVFFVSRPPLCFRYHLFVSNTISLFQIPSLCFNTLFLFQYHLFVSRATSLFQIPSLCFKNHLFVSDTISLFRIPPLCIKYHLFVLITSLCFKYHLFVSGTTSLTRKLWMLKNSKRLWKK